MLAAVMTTAAERTIDIPFESRKVYIPRGTTSDDRTVLIKFESRTVYIERQSTSAERTVMVTELY